MKKRSIIITIVVLLIAALTVFQLMRNKSKIDAANKPKETFNHEIPVFTEVATKKPLEQTLIKTGNLIPIREADINAVMSGRLVAVNFQLGSHVNQGAVVARIDNQQVLLNIESAKLQRDQAQRDYERYKALYEGDAAPEINYQNAQLQYESLVNQIDILQRQLADYNIKAPISGTVISKMKEPGEFVGPGAVLGRIVDISSLKATVKVSESDIYKLKLGQLVKVKTDVYGDQIFEGKISYISAQGDATYNYDVEISVKNSAKYPLKGGTFVMVDFTQESSEKVLAIPRSALVESTKNPYVYIVQDGVVTIRRVVLGREAGNDIEIVDGIQEGDVVVTSGQINIKEGLKVKPIAADNQAVTDSL